MRDYTYEANLESIGEGWSDAGEAVDRWNDYIAPILAEHTTQKMIDDEDEPTLSVSMGRAQVASEWAWNEFCGRGAGDSDEIAEKLGNELVEKLSK